jgi:hypothetical protein
MEKEDYLEVDDPINGQNYVCLSFVSPESMIQNKEAFKTAKFLQSMSKEEDKDFKHFYNMYLDFCYKHSDKIQKDFDSENKSQTNVRGVKVRGIYQTEEEARRRAKTLQTRDSSFNVFVGPVGYWLPWDPCADNVNDEVFMNEQLNDMIKKYKENEINKDILYEQEKREKMKDAMTKQKAEELEKQNESQEPEDNQNSEETTDTISDSLQEDDPWMKQKSVESAVKESVEELVGDTETVAEPESVTEPESVAEPEPESKVDTDSEC